MNAAPSPESDPRAVYEDPPATERAPYREIFAGLEGLILQVEAGDVDARQVLRDAFLERGNCVRSKSHVRGGKEYPGAEDPESLYVVGKGEITLFGIRDRYPSVKDPVTGYYSQHHIAKVYHITYKVGDSAEHSSWNLSYMGPITRITAKRITIAHNHPNRHDRPGAKVRVHSLDIEQFSSRNWDGLESKIERNANWSD